MNKLVDWVGGFVWGIGNLILSYYIVLSIAANWDIAFITAETLPFKHFWGWVFMFSTVYSPTAAFNAVRFKHQENGWGSCCIQAIATFTILFVYAASGLGWLIIQLPIFNNI